MRNYFAHSDQEHEVMKEDVAYHEPLSIIEEGVTVTNVNVHAKEQYTNHLFVGKIIE